MAQVAIRPADLSASGVRGRLRRWHRFPPVLLALACLTAALMAVPVAAVVIQAVSVGTAEAVRVLHRPLLHLLLLRRQRSRCRPRHSRRSNPATSSPFCNLPLRLRHSKGDWQLLHAAADR